MSEALNYHVKAVVKNVLDSVGVAYEHAQKIFDEKGINGENLQEILHTAGITSMVQKDILATAGKKIQSVSLCTDNDKAGWEIANGYKNAFDNCTTASNFYHTEYKIEIPESKDWNDELKSQVEMLEIKPEKQVLDEYVEVDVSNDSYVPAHLVNTDTQSRQNMQNGMEL